MSLDWLEQEVLAVARARAKRPARPIFILGAPRTGSTFCYQLFVAAFELPYIANLTNDYFPTHPILGLTIQAAFPIHQEITLSSRFGKTDGLLQPSEASAVMAHWFGGGHPSELRSASILSGREEHFLATLEAAEGLFGRPLVIKNAWNCFRVEYLAKTLPEACFIWMRRDLATAAKSDLAARYVVQGSPNLWNSATPRNVTELRSRPYWEQVVENQVEFARAISEAAAHLKRGRFAELWYEDLCVDPLGELKRIASVCTALSSLSPRPCFTVNPTKSHAPGLRTHDEARIDEYIAQTGQRYAGLRWPKSIRCQKIQSV